ncbi:MAG: hypothetical protein KKF44_01925 [Nanoarchaeota archaeon]|nr:hypothetical protein [Nanoarchaeota archaeon]
MPDENKIQEIELPKDLREVVQRIARDAEDLDLRVSEFKIIHSMRMYGIAIGGAIFSLGMLFILISIFMFFNLFEITLEYNYRIIVSSILGLIGLLQLIAGVLLISK